MKQLDGFKKGDSVRVFGQQEFATIVRLMPDKESVELDHAIDGFKIWRTNGITLTKQNQLKSA